jgi:hypothetical protein
VIASAAEVAQSGESGGKSQGRRVDTGIARVRDHEIVCVGVFTFT